MGRQEGQYTSLKTQTAIAALREYQARPDISHEWEEFLYKLSVTDDPKLREFACLEMAKVRATSQGISFLDMEKTGI